ncbi:MAG: UvrD-helicase domain-containing protein [Patescibacteria group bacterium]
MKDDTAQILDGLNRAQQEAVTHKNGPLLIIAGAGTGKTTVITRRIAWLLRSQKLSTENILALTFTEKAAAEMEERIDQLLPFGYMDLWVSTFHAFCERILKQHAIDIGLPPDFTILDQTNQALLVREHFDEFDLDYYRPLGNPTKFIHALLSHFSRAKDEGVTPQEYLAFAEKLRVNEDQLEFAKGDEMSEHARVNEIANAYHTYQRLLLDTSALDFGDLLLYTLKLFHERPKILKIFQQQFRHVLVDEFQDTNHAQYELVKLLVNSERNLTVVGDDDQSIYKFRGAAISNILEFKKDFSDAREIVLTENYRSKQNILDLAYGLIQQNNPNRLEVALAKSVSGEKISKKLVSRREGPAELKHIHALNQEQEARLVVEKIAEIKKRVSNTTWSDFAILVRANDHANLFLSLLDRAGIPYQFVAARGLFQQPVVLDLINYLRLLDNYHETRACFRVLGFAHWGIPISDVMLLVEESRKTNAPLYRLLTNIRTVKGMTASSIPKIEKMISLIEKHTYAAQHESAGQVALRALKETGYLASITERKDPQSTQKVLYLTQFFKRIQDFEESHVEAKTVDFLSEIQLAQEVGDTGSMSENWESGPDTVKVMTVHGAKGLEFRYVFVVSLVDKRFPSVERKEQIPLPDALVKEVVPVGDVHLEEERRLFYVALTRARDGLFLTSADDYGGTRIKKPSRFLTELGFEPKTEKLEQSLLEAEQHAVTKDTTDEMKLLRSRIPKKFSFTQFQAFESCPKQYKYAHILQIPPEGRFTFSFGKSMHQVMLHLFSEVQEKAGVGNQSDLFGAKKTDTHTIEIPFDHIKKIYEQEWINEWYVSQKHEHEYFQKGLDELRAFHTLHQGKFMPPLYIEKGFTIKVGEHSVKGVVDRLERIDGGVHIIDYKTGTAPDPTKKLSKDKLWQLYLYARAAREVFGEHPVRLSFYYFDLGGFISVDWNQKDEDDIFEKTENLIESILVSSFIPTPSQHTCKNCDFKDICEDSKA